MTDKREGPAARGRQAVNHALNERKCGACSLCCKVFRITEELTKPAGKWCEHCRRRKGGCSIYDARPAACRDFTCHWLDGKADDHWYPLNSKIVVRTDIDDNGTPVLDFNVDPSFPKRWREQPYYRDIKLACVFGLLNKEGLFFTRVVVGDNVFYVFPNRVIRRKPNISAEEAKVIRNKVFRAVAEFELRTQQLLRPKKYTPLFRTPGF
jgi:hypothetical protein